ncbi:MAG: hypothetical protein AB1468_04980, partial [Candidatus Micrarchaeota archaeon]
LQRIGKEARTTDAGKCTGIKNKMLELTSKSIVLGDTSDDVQMLGAIARDIGPISTMTTDVLTSLSTAE